ncbi:PAB1 binding protein [Aspergillus granulosus]|uniref:PAB1 binding protein n=1 Tax=Aspergillus granulosus TaxID=176169 RepID=A0ABR4HR87_9EURO
MASSTVNSAPVANSPSSNAPTQTSGSRTTLRPSSNPKSSDGGRRQSGSPLDGGQRRSNSQKAWTQGTNPITQRPSYSQQNGSMPQKSSSSPRPSSNESNTPDNHAHDRLLFLFTSFIGLATTVTTRNGDEFTGIFSSSSLEPSDSSITLKMTQRQSKQDQNRANGVSDTTSPFIGSAPEHSMTFNVNDVVDISVLNVTTADILAKPNGAAIGFKTDTDISGNLAMRERTLKRWEPGTDANTDMSLENTSAATSGWDQFETNARLFGATSSYDENIYTTRINRSDPAYKQKEAEAARIAHEIETSEVDNAHVREERGLLGADVGDEEDKYSGVRRDEKNFPPLASGQANKYTPPALRNQLTATAPAYTGPVKRTTSAKEPAPAPVPPKETTPLAQSQTTPASATGPAAETEPKVAPLKASSVTPAAAAKGAPLENNYENKVLDQFRIFATNEKLKFQERRRNQASYDRTIKLNELMKFSQNFKLATPVPKDLVPILAKDPHKQEEIIQRAQQQAEEKKTPKAVATPAPVDQKKAPAEFSQTATRQDGGAAASQAPLDRPTHPRGRQMYPPAGPGGRAPHQLHSGRQATGMLGPRLADNLQQRKGAAAGSVPAPLPIQDSRAPPSTTDHSTVSSPTKVSTPTSTVSTKFNVRAMEFKPNPAASTFTPGASSNPSVFARGQTDTRAKSPSTFFGAKKPRPISERPSLKDQFNPIKRMKKESAEQTDRDYTSNGGIPFAYNTMPTWNANGDEEKSYVQMFKYPPLAAASPQSRSASNPQMPHQPQMPYQFQQTPNMPPTSGPPHGPHLHLQQHHGAGPAHFDDPHRMQLSASTSQMFPSPRLQHGYPSPMAPHAQLAFGQQPMPQFYVNQGGPQPAHMRHYQGGPQFVNPQGGMGAPMMAQQPSNGPYMGIPQGVGPYTPQMQMYSPNPAHTYPHVPPPQPHSGYPSPSRPAPMMMHQNSQSGQPPQHVMYMAPGQHQQPVYAGQQPGHMPPGRGNYPQQQPHFQASPHQAHHYPPHQHRTPSSGFNQLPPMPPQVASQAGSAANTGAQSQETADESK